MSSIIIHYCRATL